MLTPDVMQAERTPPVEVGSIMVKVILLGSYRPTSPTQLDYNTVGSYGLLGNLHSLGALAEQLLSCLNADAEPILAPP